MSVQKIHDDRLTLGITTSVLFDMSEPNAVFERYGINGYRSYMKERIDDPLKPGPIFDWIRDFALQPHHDIVLFSKNSSLTALRSIKTLVEHDIIPRRFIFTNGKDPVSYLSAYKIDNFFSANPDDVLKARLMGVSSVHFDHLKKINPDAFALEGLVPKSNAIVPLRGQLEGGNVVTLTNKHKNAAQRQHYIFDCDGVLADDTAEDYFRQHGLEAFQELEKQNMLIPMAPGPSFPFFKKLSDLNHKTPQGAPYLISMVTARGVYAAIRSLNTLVHWDIEPNGEIHCVSGAEKGPILKILKDNYKHSAIFFDDGEKNVESAKSHGILAGRILIPPMDGPENVA